MQALPLHQCDAAWVQGGQGDPLLPFIFRWKRHSLAGLLQRDLINKAAGNDDPADAHHAYAAGGSRRYKRGHELPHILGPSEESRDKQSKAEAAKDAESRNNSLHEEERGAQRQQRIRPPGALPPEQAADGLSSQLKQ